MIEKEIVFTDYNTVLSDLFKETTIEVFFCKLEELIENNYISNPTIDYKHSRLTFEYNNKKYYLILSNQEIQNIKTGIPSRRTKKFLDLFNLQHKVELSGHIEKEKEEVQKNRLIKISKRRQTLLRKAINGIIENDEAKEIYIDYLKEELERLEKGIITRIKNTYKELYKKNRPRNKIISIAEEYTWSTETLIIGLISIIAGIIVGPIVSFRYNPLLVFYFLPLLPTGMLILLKPTILARIITSIPTSIISMCESLKINLKETKNKKQLINHKIESLRKINMGNNNELEEESNTEELKINSTKYKIALLINEINIDIDKLLPNQRKEYMETFLKIIEAYKNRMEEYYNSGILKIETEDAIVMDIYIKLEMLSNEIKTKIEKEKEDRYLNSKINSISQYTSTSHTESTQKLTLKM